MLGDFSVGVRPSAFQEGLSSIELVSLCAYSTAHDGGGGGGGKR
jgi:hypothetical protein